MKFKFLYLPALADGVTRWIPLGRRSAQNLGTSKTRNPLQQLSFNNWMDESVRGTPAYYPDVLITYYYFRDRAINFSKDAYVFGDSGGFSVMRFGMSKAEGAPHQRNVDMVDVLRWQERNCSVGVVLDVPPIDPNEIITNKKNKRPERILWRAQAATVKHTRRALDTYLQMRREGTEFRWWGAVHGWTPSQMHQWWSKVSEVYPFVDSGEGWTFKARDPSSNPIAIATCLHFIKSHNIRRAHFLAAAAPGAAATMMVLGGQADLELLTADAQTADVAARNRHVIRPVQDGLAIKPIEERGKDDVGRQYLRQCDCYSCSQIPHDREAYPKLVDTGYNEYWTHRFIFHNNIMLFQLMARLQKEADLNPDALLQTVLGKTTYSAVLKAFDGRLAINYAEGIDRPIIDRRPPPAPRPPPPPRTSIDRPLTDFI